MPFQWFYHRFGSQQVCSDYLTRVYEGLLEESYRRGQGTLRPCRR